MTTFIRPPWASPVSVSSTLIIAPTEEPITLEEAKLRAGLPWADGDPRDQLMRDFIAAARDKVERDTALALLTQTREIVIAARIDGIMPLPAQALPVQSITTPDGQPIDPDTWTIDWSTRTLFLMAPAYLPGGAWRIVSGWPTPAALKAEAPLLVHAVGLLTAHLATVGRDLATVGTIINETVYGYDEAIAPYRMVTLCMIRVRPSIAERPHLVRVQNPGAAIPEPEGGGSYTHEWADLIPPTLFVSIEQATARSLEEVGGGTVTATATHVIRGPWHPQISTLSRLVFNERIFQVAFVGNREERNVDMALVCAEVLTAEGAAPR